jgi:hypothetical protein
MSEPNRSDKERAQEFITGYRNGECNYGDLAQEFAAVRAEATLAERERDGTWERLSRDTAEGLNRAIAALAAQAAEIAALREALRDARAIVQENRDATPSPSYRKRTQAVLEKIDAALKGKGEEK